MMVAPQYKELKGEGSVESQADEAWDYSRSRSSGVFTDLFAGQLQSSLQCPHAKCGKFSHNFDEIFDLSLPLVLESSSGSACNIQVSNAYIYIRYEPKMAHVSAGDPMFGDPMLSKSEPDCRGTNPCNP